MCYKYMNLYRSVVTLIEVIHMYQFPLSVKLSTGVFIRVDIEEETREQDNLHQQSKATHH